MSDRLRVNLDGEDMTWTELTLAARDRYPRDNRTMVAEALGVFPMKDAVAILRDHGHSVKDPYLLLGGEDCRPPRPSAATELDIVTRRLWDAAHEALVRLANDGMGPACEEHKVTFATAAMAIVLDKTVKTLTACSMARAWFEGNPEGALEEIETRAQEALKDLKGEGT